MCCSQFFNSLKNFKMSKSTQYAQQVEGSKKSGFSHIYRNPNFMNQLVSVPQGNYTSLRDIIEEKCLKQFPDLNYLGKITLTTKSENGKTVEKREIKSFKYKEVFRMAESLGSWILNNKIEYTEDIHRMKLIGIISKNRYEWVVTDHACCLYGLTLVPLYETFGLENMEYCLQHSGITSCFVTLEAVKTLLKMKKFGNLKNIISFDPLPREILEKLRKLNFRVTPFSVTLLRDESRLIKYRLIKVNRDSICTFSYTSGTTGPPKGAMLSHGNFLSSIVNLTQNSICALNGQDILQPGDIHLSYLPLAHVFGRGGILYSLFSGLQAIFYCGDITKLKDDMAFVKPHMFLGVPKIFHRIADGIKKKFSNMDGISKKIVDWGLDSKMNNLEKTGAYQSCFFDGLVFSAVREAFGGRLKFMISGGAPIKPETYQFMKAVTSCPMAEGYGLTEASLMICFQTPDNSKTGHLGKLLNTWEMKLADIPEMNYTSEDVDEGGNRTPRGEIWVRGAGVFKGYYRDQAKTKQAITQDGWLKTGDVGMLFSDQNMIKVIDRKKNIFKLQQGQYVAPEKVEAIYSSQLPITQAFLYGSSTQDYAVAVVAGDKDQMIKLGKNHGINLPYEQLCKNKRFRSLVWQNLYELGVKKDLKGFQQAKNIYIQPLSFLQREILTNTMKLRRFEARKCYRSEIKALYDQGPIVKS